MEASFDIILTRLGTGKWNISYYISLMYWYSLLTYHTLGGAFFAPPVDHTCRPPTDAHTATVILPPVTDHNITSYSPKDTHLATDASCSYLVQDPATGNLKEEACTDWVFDNSTFIYTVTSEFQLVCDRKYLRATYQSMYMFGVLVGAGFNGFLADRFGRLTMITIASIAYTIISVGSAWLPTLSTLIAARFLLGIMHPTSLQTGYILIMEVTEMKMRSRIGILQFISWTAGTMLWGGWAYLVRNWRWLQTMVSLPCLLFLPAL